MTKIIDHYKCAHKDRIIVGSSLSWSRMQLKKNQNNHRNQNNEDNCVGEPPGMHSAKGSFVYKQRLGGHGVASHGMICTE